MPFSPPVPHRHGQPRVPEAWRSGCAGKRPFKFVDSLKICRSIQAAITDEELRTMREYGAADEFLGNNFVPAVPHFSRAATAGLLKATL
ncbi:MAG: hypothetical protein E5W89_31730 [Mesorhizobium sp.]|nr:MAG: hypothetical protein E5W89_31730 [Mesorhizobium sp.]